LGKTWAKNQPRIQGFEAGREGREIAEREGYDSISEFVRALLEKAIKERHKKRES
jgi:hypothetical protein